jgi:DNA gyrase inhibitor GyrI
MKGDVQMSDIEVRIVRLEPTRVASAHGFGEQPEIEAWNILLSWVKSMGMLDNLKEHRFFGFNNLDPSPGSPNYGYEQWLIVDPHVEGEGDVTTKDFLGGLYAVAGCTLSNIGESWKQLVTWVEGSKYAMGNQQCLEECLNPEIFITSEGIAAIDETMLEKINFDLYLSISEGDRVSWIGYIF